MFGLSKQTLIIIGALVVVLLLFSFRDGGGAGASGGQGSCQFTVTADVLNVRQAPAMNAPVVGKLTGDEETGARSTVRNGFREIAADRWAAAEFLDADGMNTC